MVKELGAKIAQLINEISREKKIVSHTPKSMRASGT